MQASELFTALPQEQLELSNKLKMKIIHQIEANHGAIPFSQFMHLALYDPEWGYYSNLLPKFGQAGDFITSPVVSSLFGRCIAQQIMELHAHGVKANILEIGAGNGQLMLDLFSELGDRLEHYYILELSATLIQLQQQRLKETYPELSDKVIWLEQLPKAFEGIILANEVLDAQPCERVLWNNDEVKSQHVSWNGNAFVYQEASLANELAIVANSLPINSSNYVSEINLNNRGFIRALAECLSCGAILLIDYGYAEAEYYAPWRNKGTLRGFFAHHQLDDVLVYPGLIDITASVDFSALVTTALHQQLEFIGYTTQANFLFNCNLLSLMSLAQAQLSPGEYLALSNQVNRLTSPNDMGEVFKVVAFSRGIEFANWRGFASGDRSYTL
jgi:SAM-dependent MidA family methyltransferase